MALTKPPVLPPWAEAGDKVQPTNAEIQTGWPLSNTPPARQRWNWILNFLANGIRYLTRRGMPDYGADETYMIGDRVIGDDGKTYRSIQDNNTGNAPSASPLWWERWGFGASELSTELNKLDYKTSCRVATTANLAALSGLLTIDGVVLVAGDRVLVKDQAVGSQNGIYVAAVGAWARAADADDGAKLNSGAIVPVEAGTVNGDTLWMLTTDGAITIGVTSLAFNNVQGNVGVAGTYDVVTTDAKGRVVSGQLLNALPFSSLPYPTVDNANGYPIINSAVVGGTGGNVTITAGTRFALGETVSAGLGRMRGFTTPAWTSPNLDANSTYYLRCQVQSGAAIFYVQKGTDSDAIPGSLLGTPNGANSGGFDSTQIDMLCAKIVTGANGTAPTVVPLSNFSILKYKGSQSINGTTAAGGYLDQAYSYTLNWARTPKALFTAGTSGIGPAAQALDIIYSTSESATRYTASHTVSIDYQNDTALSVTTYSRVLAVA